MYIIEKEMFEGKEIRVIVGAPKKYYVGYDLTSALGFKNNALAIRQACDLIDVADFYRKDFSTEDKDVVRGSKLLGVDENGYKALIRKRDLESSRDANEIQRELANFCSNGESDNFAPNLTVFSKDIIPAYRTDTGEYVVIGRELHHCLDIKTQYNVWINRMIAYGFKENIDYFTLLKNERQNFGFNSNPNSVQNIVGQGQTVDHILSFDMAKHIAIVQRTPQGMEIRQKLIDLENMVSQSKQVTAFPSVADHALLEKMCKIMDKQYEIVFKQERAIADLSHQIDELRGDFLRSVTPVLEASNLQEQNPYIKIINKGPVSENVTNIAKVYGYKAQDLNKILKDLGIQEKEGTGWKLCPEYEGYGYTAPGATYTNSDGSTTTQMKWTRKGRYFIHDLLTANGLV